MNTKQFYRFYDGAFINDAGIFVSDEARQFFHDFKVALKRELSCYDIMLSNFNVGHYDCSFLCEKNGDLVYCTYSIKRGLPLDLDANDIIYKRVQGTRDLNEKNSFSNWLSLAENISNMLTFERRNAS